MISEGELSWEIENGAANKLPQACKKVTDTLSWETLPTKKTFTANFSA